MADLLRRALLWWLSATADAHPGYRARLLREHGATHDTVDEVIAAGEGPALVASLRRDLRVRVPVVLGLWVVAVALLAVAS